MIKAGRTGTNPPRSSLLPLFVAAFMVVGGCSSAGRDQSVPCDAVHADLVTAQTGLLLLASGVQHPDAAQVRTAAMRFATLSGRTPTTPAGRTERDVAADLRRIALNSDHGRPDTDTYDRTYRELNSLAQICGLPRVEPGRAFTG